MLAEPSLNSLCDPRSIAIVGASAKSGSAGHSMLSNLVFNGFKGAVFPVNPKYDSIDGFACYPDLQSLPQQPDLVVLGVSNARLEDTFDEAIAIGAKAITIFASGMLHDDDAHSSLLARLKNKAKKAGVVICGPNCMGLLRPATGLNVGTFPTANKMPEGGVVWLAQSGSAFSALTYNQPRLGFVLAASTGAEIVTTISDYMLWAIEQPETRVIGIFLEGVRNPAGFVAALEEANRRKIPVVILKVGRTQKSAKMAESHAGALAGNDGAYQALFYRYNVIQVNDMDEMAVTLALLDTDRKFGPGALASIHDSGGERELLVDLADFTGTKLAEVSETTKKRIQPNLETGLIADNPLDAYGTTDDYIRRYTNCAQALLDDPATAVLGFFSDPRNNNSYHDGLIKAALAAAENHEKPVFIASNTQMTLDTNPCELARAGGLPLVKGTRETLLAVKRISVHTNRQCYSGSTPKLFDIPLQAPSDEAEGLSILNKAGIETPSVWRVSSDDDLAALANKVSFPVVLKTNEGHAHKSDIGGVALNLSNRAELAAAYSDMSTRLGPQTTVMEMAPDGVEIGIGAFIDPDYGPVITVSAGGILIEVFKDVRFALAPFDEGVASELVRSLRIAKMLEGHRGKPGMDIAKLSSTISHFSHLIYQLRHHISEADVNPVIACPDRTIAVDALFISSNLEPNHGP